MAQKPPLSPISPGAVLDEDIVFPLQAFESASITEPLALTPSTFYSSITPNNYSRSTEATQEPPQDEHGNYYCDDPKCANRPQRFARKCEWERHRDTHTRPYICRLPGCEKIQGFTYSGGLLRHEREVHQQRGEPIKRHFCPYTDCKRSEGQSFSRKENLTEHIRRIHHNIYPEELKSTVVSAQTLSNDDSGYASNIPVSTKNDHFLASELVKILQPLCSDDECFPGNIISDLLSTFARKLGYQTQKRIEYDATGFILEHQNEIVSTLQDRWRSHRRVTQRSRVDEMNLDERVKHWQENLRSEIQPSKGYPRLPEWPPQPSQERPLVSWSEMSQKTIFYDLDLQHIKISPAYIWLTRKVMNLSRLNYLGTTVFASIQQIICDCFPKPQRLSRQTTVLSQMIFNVEWPLMQFLQGYRFDGADDVASILQNFIAITSDGNHAQAMTVVQYCRLVWGQTGEQILDLVADLVRDGEAKMTVAQVTVTAEIDAAIVCFKVAGLPDSIAEVGEQLAWIGAVFRASPIVGNMHDCFTFITSVKKIQCKTVRAPGGIQDLEVYSCHIMYCGATSKTIPKLGDCWHNLFRYGIIAHGFPIAKRADSVHGLEMTLDTMLALCHARHISRFNDKIIIKGFSSMFTLSRRRSGASVWHFSGDPDGSHISFSCAPTSEQYLNLGIHDILHDRHFVGWCLDASYGAGALDSHYSIRHSEVPLTYPGCLLDGKTMRRGQTYPVANVCIADSKDTPRRTATQSLRERLKRIHIRPVVLWDDDDKRGWLTNGTSALLHLILASVENNGNPFDKYCLRKEDIRQQEKHNINAAAHILLDEHNWKLPIQWDDGRPIYFRDRVEDLYFLLDVAIEHQITSLSNGRMLSGTLEGWDFMDMAGMAIDPLNPRAFVLDKNCRGWMTFLEDTRAITLFGKDFGDIFQPRSTLCSYWSTLPKHSCYLAANMCDLEVFAKAYHGSNKSSPRKLTANTIWPSLPEIPATCTCSVQNPHHIDLVQVLVPKDLSAQAENSEIVSPTLQKGAVIFGEVKDCQWFRSGYYMSPQPNPLKRARYETDSEPYDSGIGDSGSSVTAVDSMDCSTSPTDYYVAIICALPEELLAVRQLFDQNYTNVEFDEHDENSYAFGRMSCHNIVAACLPGIYGACSSANLITELKRSFPNVEFCLLVGIGGGIPSKKNDIRLGDIVVSCPKGNHSGTIKHDFLRITQGSEPELLGCQREPPARLLSAISLARSNPDYLTGSGLLQDYISEITKEHPEYSFPGVDLDILYKSDYCYNPTTTSCTAYEYVIQRNVRTSTQPYIHYGLVASGDQVIKDSKTRDRIAQQYDALCFEMEAAGVVNVLPSLIIRGICDYADSHKNDTWNKYAAATAAAYAKFLLDRVRPKKL